MKRLLTFCVFSIAFFPALAQDQLTPWLAVHYYKFGSQDSWKVYQTMSTSINLITETDW